MLALLVPKDVAQSEANASLREELAALARPRLQLGLLVTALGFAGLFTVFTYIQPMLIEITGFSQEAVSPILLVFGLGLSIGNVAGGRLADRGLTRALLGSLAGLAIVLVALAPALHVRDAGRDHDRAFGSRRLRHRRAAAALRAADRPAPPDRTSPRASTSRPSISATPWAPGSAA